MSGSAEAQQRFENARTAFQSGDLARAETACRQILAAEPRFAGAIFLLGMISARRDEPETAIGLFREVLAIEPNAFEAMDWLASLLRARGDAKEAIELGERAVGLRPNSPTLRNSLGLSYLSVQQLPGAIASFQEAIRLKPNVAAFHDNLGVALQTSGRSEEAEGAFRQAIALAPDVPGPLMRLGQLLVQEGRRTEAIELFQGALSTNPNIPNVHMLLGEALALDGQDAKAQAHFRMAEAGDARTNLELGLKYQELGRFTDAQSAFERSIELKPNQGAAYQALVASKKVKDEDRPMLDVLNHLAQTELPPEEASLVHYALGKASEDLADYQAAMKHFREANKIAAGHLRLGFDKGAHKAYIDQIISAFTPETFRRNHGVGSESQLPLLIVGMIRSGTTLTEQILSSHPNIGAGGELRFWYEKDSLVRNVRSGLAKEEATKAAAEYLRLLERLSPGKLRVTDKMPLNFLMLGLIHIVFPKAKIIHCRRNPVDNCISIFTTHWRVAPPRFAYDESNIVFFYEQYLRLMDHWRKVLPNDALMEVDYEELVADRERLLRQLVEFAGLPWDESVMHHEKNERTVGTPSFWQVRQPIYKTSVERWRRYEPWLGEFKKLLNT